MGIYTNISNTGVSTDYRSVEPFVGEHFNYHELGIIAATEMATNHNSFMKAIALNELAAYEQTGSTDVLYESVNIKGIFEKIKMFFKKIIEKIHKIFHTFIAKMSSWFGNSASFAKKYEKEIIKGWANVKNDWGFKGYNFKNAILTKTKSNDLKVESNGLKQEIANLLNNEGGLSNIFTNVDSQEDIKTFREHLDDSKNNVRKGIIDSLKNKEIPDVFNIGFDKDGLEQSEYTEELFKIFRNDEDSKVDLEKKDIEKCYGGSISTMISFIKDFDKIKSNLEKSEKNITSGIDKLIKNMDKAENDLIKENNTESKKGDTADKNKINKNELIIQASSLYQSIWGAISESMTQAFSALLQANKDACSQAKEIAVKVIGQSKKMTESYDYGSSTDGGFSFIDSVKLV